MNTYVKNRSTTFLILSWVFILALFFDGANLTDILPGVTTIHFEEGDGSQNSDQLAAITNPAPTVFSFAELINHSDVSKQKPFTFKRVILDQDSPSLAATSIIAFGLFSLFPRNEQATCKPVLLTELLYLENHSFLL